MSQQLKAQSAPISGLKGIRSAQKNNTYHRERRHPWTKEYRKSCIISDCESPVYFDGEIHWTCCLHHLHQLQLGPYAPRISHDLEGWPLRCADTASQVHEALARQSADYFSTESKTKEQIDESTKCADLRSHDLQHQLATPWTGSRTGD